MKKRGGDEWVVDPSEDEDPPRLAPRFRNIAVGRLGYTHTEAGRRQIGQIFDELEDLARLEREAREGPEDLGWLEKEGEE